MAAILKFTWLTGFFTRMTQEVQSVIFWCFFPDLKDFFAYLLYYMAVYPFTNHVTLGAGGVTVSAWMCCMLLICEDKKPMHKVTPFIYTKIQRVKSQDAIVTVDHQMSLQLYLC